MDLLVALKRPLLWLKTPPKEHAHDWRVERLPDGRWRLTALVDIPAGMTTDWCDYGEFDTLIEASAEGRRLFT